MRARGGGTRASFSSFTCWAGELTRKVNIKLPDRQRKFNDKLNVSKHGVDATGREPNRTR